MKIFLRIDKHYNKVFYYPDCPTSELFARLTGTKTLTPEALTIIKKLGYELCTKTLKIVSVEPKSRYMH